MKLCFVSILAEPGTYDRAIYDGVKGGDNECIWVEDALAHLSDVTVHGYRVAEGEATPDPGDGDAFILGGSYNSVHDGFAWQTETYHWLDRLRAAGKPLLAICGGHQMICHQQGIPVEMLPGGVIAGTEPVSLSEDGRASPLFAGIDGTAEFQFGNQEHVTEVPSGATLLARHERAPVVALDYGEGWYSTQFHPEANAETFKAHWQSTTPEHVKNYRDSPNGLRLIENFIGHVYD